MFFKKKKPEIPPEQEHQVIAPGQSPVSQSKFAPGLNVNTGQIDFGLTSFTHDTGNTSTDVQPAVPSFDPWHQPEAQEEVAPWTPPEPISPMSPHEEVDMPPMAPDIVSPLVESWQSVPVLPDMPVSSAVPPLENTITPIEPIVMPTEMTPEQAWGMLEPSAPTAPMPGLSDEAPDFALSHDIAPFAPTNQAMSESAEPMAPFNPQDEWAVSFETPVGSVAPAVDSLASAQMDAVPPLAADSSLLPLPEVETSASWSSGFEEFNLAPQGPPVVADPLSPDFGSPAPATPDSFETAVASDWMTMNPQDVAFETSGISEPLASSASDWGKIAPPLESASFESANRIEQSAYSANEGFMADALPENQAPVWELSAESASQAPSNFDFLSVDEAAAETSLDALWESPAVQAEVGLHSRFEPTGSGVGLQPWEISEPHLGLPEVAPGLMSPSQPMTLPGEELAAFDPMQASQELAAGWPQVESVVAPETFEAKSSPISPGLSGLDWADEIISPLESGSEWANVPGAPPEPVYFHEAPAVPEAEAQLWNNLTAPESAPGEQVPYTSGAMMDAINQQLYPEDPFSGLDDNFSAGEQAFADAARYLFPETANAPLEWEDGGYGPADESGADIFGDEDEDVGVINLGPSYSKSTDSFVELAGLETTPMNPYPMAPEPEAFSGVLYQQPPSGSSSVWESPEPIAPLDISEDVLQSWGAQAGALTPAEPVIYQPEVSSAEVAWAAPLPVQEPLAPLDEALVPPVYAPPLPAPEPIVSEPAIWTPDTVSSSGLPGVLEPESFEVAANVENLAPLSDWNTAQLESPEAAATIEIPTPWENLGPLPAPHVTEEAKAPMEASLQAEQWQAEAWATPQAMGSAETELPAMENTAMDESDFYATAFTLNELGELVPIHEDEMFSGLEAMNLPAATSVYEEQPSAQPMPAPEASFSRWDESIVTPQGVGPSMVQPVTPEISVPPMESAAMGMPAARSVPPEATMPHSGPLQPLPAAFPTEPVPQQTAAPARPAVPPAMPAFSPEQFLAASRNRFAPPTTPPMAAQSAQGIIPNPAQPQMPPSPAVASFMPQAQAPVLPPVQPVTPPAEVPPVAEAPKTIRPKPLTFKAPVIPPVEPEPAVQPPMSQLESHHLESQWYSPEPAGSAVQASAPLPSTSTMEMKLTLGNLEVMGLCQLSPERRLLVVHNEGVYALMSQTGQESSNVHVLKIFEHNPLAYQHTFTAVEEAKAAGQGMYVIQVGTWHAIISTFQDKISLHTELG